MKNPLRKEGTFLKAGYLFCGNILLGIKSQSIFFPQLKGINATAVIIVIISGQNSLQFKTAFFIKTAGRRLLFRAVRFFIEFFSAFFAQFGNQFIN